MFGDTLATTNLMLGILAAVGVLEVVTLAIALVLAIGFVRRTRDAALDTQRQLAALLKRLEDLATTAEGALADVKSVTTLTASGARSANRALQRTLEIAGLVSGAAGATAGRGTFRLLAVVLGVVAAYRSLATSARTRTLAPGRSPA